MVAINIARERDNVVGMYLSIPLTLASEQSIFVILFLPITSYSIVLHISTIVMICGKINKDFKSPVTWPYFPKCTVMIRNH